MKLRGIFLVSLGFFCLREPDAAFLGLAKSFFKLLKSLFFMKTSPLISTSFGKSLFVIWWGMSPIVFKFSVISSPVVPSPLEVPKTSNPFL